MIYLPGRGTIMLKALSIGGVVLMFTQIYNFSVSKHRFIIGSCYHSRRDADMTSSIKIN